MSTLWDLNLKPFWLQCFNLLRHSPLSYHFANINYHFAHENWEKPILCQHFFLPAQITILPMQIEKSWGKKIWIVRVTFSASTFYNKNGKTFLSHCCETTLSQELYDLHFKPTGCNMNKAGCERVATSQMLYWCLVDVWNNFLWPMS